jgi:hypothetical protein
MSSSVFIIRIQDKQSETAWKVHAEYRGDSTGEKNDIFEFSAEDFRHLNTLSTKDYGIYLGKALFQNDLREFFKSAFHSSQKLMKVTLSIDVENSSNSDNLRALHWERLCVPMDQSWQYLPLEQRLPFSHHVSTANLDRKYSPIQKDNLKALVLVASPENLETEYNLASFDIEVTVAGIRSAFGDIPCDILANHIEDAIGLPTLKKLIECLTNTNPPYTILHIVSHGSIDQRGNTWLYWSNEANQVEPILGGDLIEKLCIVQNLPHLIFLCSCSSANYCGGLAQGIIQTLATPTVVAMTDSVSIKTATELAHNFYPRLLKSGEVDVALQQAAAPLAERHDITIPALFSSRLDNQFLFLSPSVKEIVDNSPNSKNLNIDHSQKSRDKREFEYDAYISYVDEEPDSTWVWNILVPKLEDAGLKIAVSGDTDIAGVAKVVNIERGLKLSRRTLVVLSALYLANTMGEFENVMIQTISIQEGTARLVIIEKDAVDLPNLPYRLQQLTAVKLNHPHRAEREFQKLIQQLKQPLPYRTSDGVYEI